VAARWRNASHHWNRASVQSQIAPRFFQPPKPVPARSGWGGLAMSKSE